MKTENELAFSKNGLGNDILSIRFNFPNDEKAVEDHWKVIDDVGIHIEDFLSNYFDWFEETDRIYYFRKNDRCILLADEDYSGKTYFLNLRLRENDIIINSYPVEKIRESIEEYGVSKFIAILLNNGFKLSKRYKDKRYNKR